MGQSIRIKDLREEVGFGVKKKRYKIVTALE